MLARIERLTAEWIELKQLADEFDSLQAAAATLKAANTPWDTLTVGALNATTESRHMDVVRPAVLRAWRSAEDEIGGASNVLRETTFRVRIDSIRIRANAPPGSIPGSIPATRITVSTEDAENIAGAVEANEDRLIEAAGNAVATAIQRHLASLVPEEIESWAGAVPPVTPDFDTRRAYIEMIASQATTARLCWERNFDACRRGLGLTSVEDRERSEFDRDVVLVHMDQLPLHRETVRESRNECVEQRALAVCSDLRKQFHLPPFVLSRHQNTLVTHAALREGGPGAFIRLVNSSGTVVERLEFTAGVPLDSILAIWRDDVDRAAGTPVRVTTSTGIATVLWTFVFLLAATRSTRWRSR